MSRTSSFMGFTEADDKALHLGRVMLILMPAASIIFTLSTTFYTIFIAEALGGAGGFLEGLGLLGVLIAIEMITQTLLDYPSGALGDALGQRWVIAIGNLLYGVVFFMVSLVTSATPFLYLVAVYVIQGIAQSQISGAWGAWFDNNYKVAMPEDKQRKQYGVFQGRMGMISQIAATAALIPGSILAVVFQRAFVFQIEAVGAVIFALLVLRYVRDFPEVEALRSERPSMSEYTSLLKEGVNYLWKTPFVKYMVIGSMVCVSAISVWGQLILFPLYFSYLITDVAVASYRTIAFIPGVAANERSGIWSRKFEPKKWIPRFRLLQACGFVFFVILAIVMAIFPPIPNATQMVTLFLPFTNLILIELPIQHVIPIICMFCLFTVSMFFGGFAEVLTQRELLDSIPSRNRNSLYSLQPTILLLISTPQIAIIGWLIPIIGFPATLLICSAVSLSGVLIIRYALTLEKPVVEMDDAVETIEKSPEELVELSVDLSSETLLDDVESVVRSVPE
ncbi:MFS transporter [Candidatus Thorarchaeota archaeon]|nr:MAG: MFS transporter [Candidatus Thorarchaeota archaeon]